MKNITVSVDEETQRLARIRAAELETSVSALVRDYLRGLALGRHACLPRRQSGLMNFLRYRPPFEGLPPGGAREHDVQSQR